jgi:hypothetical protein
MLKQKHEVGSKYPSRKRSLVEKETEITDLYGVQAFIYSNLLNAYIRRSYVVYVLYTVQ